MNTTRRQTLATLAAVPAALAFPQLGRAQGKIVLGFSQIGAESEWRTANTESIKASAKEAGIGSLRIGAQMWNYLPAVERTIKIPPSMDAANSPLTPDCCEGIDHKT